MASLFSFGEDNGAPTGSPAKGTTRTTGRADSNWKNIDDSTTVYSTQPILAGGNSFLKFQFGAVSGTFNTIQNAKFYHTSGTFGAGLTLKCLITGSGGYVAPVTGTLASGTDITTSGTIAANGLTCWFSTGGPEQTTSGTNASLSAATGYSSYFVTQLQTTTGASPGDTVSAELTFQYDES